MPAIYGMASRDVIKLQVFTGRNLGQHDDLPGVHGEMFCDVKDRLEHRYLPALDNSFFKQRPWIESLQNLVDFTKSCLEPIKQDRSLSYFTLGKLCFSYSLISSLANAGNDPLS